MATKTDPRGVVITYGYDGLNRLSSISYNTSSAPALCANNRETRTAPEDKSS